MAIDYFCQLTCVLNDNSPGMIIINFREFLTLAIGLLFRLE